jgi:anti-anti-sigma factor
MEVKIDTKEKFTVIQPLIHEFTANIASAFIETCSTILHQPVKNVILNLCDVSTIDDSLSNTLVDLQQQFYDNNASFVICNLTESVDAHLEKLELNELLNITPTESEAWDIVQMEEIERELMDSDDMSFENND